MLVAVMQSRVESQMSRFLQHWQSLLGLLDKLGRMSYPRPDADFVSWLWFHTEQPYLMVVFYWQSSNLA